MEGGDELALTFLQNLLLELDVGCQLLLVDIKLSHPFDRILLVDALFFVLPQLRQVDLSEAALSQLPDDVKAVPLDGLGSRVHILNNLAHINGLRLLLLGGCFCLEWWLPFLLLLLRCLLNWGWICYFNRRR